MNIKDYYNEDILRKLKKIEKDIENSNRKNRNRY